MAKNKNIRARQSKVLVWAALVIILIAICAGTLVWVRHRKHNISTATPDTPQSAINFGPPTTQELQETEQHKEQLQQQIDNPTPAPSGARTVTPVISSWGQNPDKSLVISAFIPDIYEDGGTCTLTLTMSGTTVTRTAAGHKDVNRTSCENFTIAYSDIKTGDWMAVIHYDSPSATGNSSNQSIAVN